MILEIDDETFGSLRFGVSTIETTGKVIGGLKSWDITMVLRTWL